MLENSPSHVAVAMAGGAWGCSTAGSLLARDTVIQCWVNKSKIGSMLENPPSHVALAMTEGASGCSTAGSPLVRDDSILG